MRVDFYRHNIEEEDVHAVCEVLRGAFLTTGPRASQFEDKLGEYLGIRRVVALSSATAALHLGLEALGVGPGDEVITTPLTFAATATAICHRGAKPVLVDVEPDTGNLDIALVEAAVTDKTRVILPVHLYGQMCDMVGLERIAAAHGLSVLEDAAHALEAERDGLRPGHRSQGACFSFYATKNLSCGEGGALATQDDALAEKLVKMRLHGMSKDASTRYTEGYRHYDIELCGWKYNLDDIHAALLVKQIDRIEGYAERRLEIFKKYENAFSAMKGVTFPRRLPRSRHALHLFTIWVDPEIRDRFLVRLQEMGVGVSVNFRPLHLMRFFRERFQFEPGMFPEAERIGGSTITLPLYPKLTNEEVEYVIEAVALVSKEF